MKTRMCSQMQVVVVVAVFLLVLVSRVRTAPRIELPAHLLQSEADGKEVRINCDNLMKLQNVLFFVSLYCGNLFGYVTLSHI